MILKNSLYKILSSNNEENAFNLELVPDCLIYRAHFPEQPITPGVCIIQIATELLSDLLNTEFELASVANAKFLTVINPLVTKNITYSFKKIVPDIETNAVKVSVVVCNSDTVFTKLSLVCRRNGLR